MATNGLVSIVDESGKVIIKVVAGCNGYHAGNLVSRIQEYKLDTIESVFEAAKHVGFGCVHDLVVMDKESELGATENLSDLYRQKFDDPKFNPRWHKGTAAYTELITI